jgi:Flp pilus assembly pilin Flp
MYIKNKRGQSTVEYVLLVTAVIAVIIAIVTSNNGGMQGQLNSTLNTAIGDVGTLSDRMPTSVSPSAPGNVTNPESLNVLP